MINFVNLHVQTDLSILDSLISPKELFVKAKELEQTAVAITDHGSLGAVWDCFKISKDVGIKLIVGCECYFQNDSENGISEKLRHIVLLATNAVGYRNLLTLNKKGFDQSSFIGKRVYSVIDWKLLEQYSEGLICLTACGNGILSQLLMNGKFDEAEDSLIKLKTIFKERLGVEVQPNNMKRGSNIFNDQIDQQFLNKKLIDLGKKHNVKVVAACNSHYVNKEDSDTHDLLLAIGSHQPKHSGFRLKYPVADFYMKSGDEVKNFFARNYGEEFAEEICANTIYFSDMCETPKWIDPKFSNKSGKELPIFPVKNESDYNDFKVWLIDQDDIVKNLPEDKSYMRYKIYSSFTQKIIDDKISNEQLPLYKERIIKELDVLEYLDISSYMLITADFLNYARKHNISVGFGRGSVGGCYLAYLLNIHQADSIKYGLVFERFHNKLKGLHSYSDIDNDLSNAGRDRVIDYVFDKYGKDYVAHVSNINKNTPKMYIKDVARACELGGSKEEAVKIGAMIADCVSADIHSIDEAFLKAPLFAEYCKKYPEFLKYSKICNKPRANATHAAGVIVAKRPLVGLVPIRKDKDGNISLEYTKDTAEENGLVKIDFLGVTTLDIIDNVLYLIKKSGKKVPNINVEEYDEKTYNLISNGDTFGVFQFGTSAGTIDLCRKIKPKSIDDLAIITTLARPAAREIRSDFILTREGGKKVNLLHPSLGRAFKNTYGFPLFDESLLILAEDVAGWDLGEADKLRKLTKEKGKNPKKAKQWRDEFIEGTVKNNISQKIAEEIWEKIVSPYGNYSFNKSLHHLENVNIYDENGIFLKSKPIKDVMAGEYVRSRDEKSKKDIFVKVSGNHDHGKLPLIEIELVSGEKVKCTMNHKFRTTKNGEMLPLWKIMVEENLTIVVNTEDSKINNINFIGYDQTIDLEIDHKDHQFYLSNGMLTSNSHAVLYSMTSFKTAYLKAHFPIEFLLANLMSEVKSGSQDAKGNIEKIKKEFRKHNVKILPPDINKSALSYTIENDDQLITGLDALKFVGDEAIKDIIEKRPFKDFFDFMSRVDSRKTRANNIQSLIASGAMDSFKISRKLMFLYVSDYRKKLQIWLKKHDPLTEQFCYIWPNEEEWTIQERYALEQYYMNESFVCKAPEAYGNFFKGPQATIFQMKKQYHEECKLNEEKVKKEQKKVKLNVSSFKGIVRDFFEFRVKKETSKYYGQPMIKATIEDRNGDQCSCTIFPDKWAEVKERIKNIHNKAQFGIGMALNFSGNVNVYEDDIGIILDSLFNIAKMPDVPKDLKAKKINLKEAKAKLNQVDIEGPVEINELFENIENDLYDQGLIDYDENSDDM